MSTTKASESRYTMDIQSDVLVQMADGVRLAVDIYRPKSKGRFPAILEYTCYRKDLIDFKSRKRRYEYFVKRGYVCLVFDVRGTGNSTGFNTDMYSPEERSDGYDMVEWTARQPWCTGAVGMWGISFCGVVTLQVAMQAPPHLKAIIVRSGTDDIFTEWTNPGGSPRPYIYEFYSPTMAALNSAPPKREIYGGQWQRIWQERLEQNQPWGNGFIKHLIRDEYWQSRSLRPEFNRIQCPTFVIGGWADWYSTSLLRTFSSIDTPRRALIGPWSHWWPHEALPGPRLDTLAECLSWFDTWLKGHDSEPMENPRVTVFVRQYQKPATMTVQDRGYWRSSDRWPFADTARRVLHLNARDQLVESVIEEAIEKHPYTLDPFVRLAAGRHGCGAFPAWGRPTDQRADEAACLTFTTEPLSEDIEILGAPEAFVFVSSSGSNTSLSLKMTDVAPDGTSALMTSAYLNAAFRNSWQAPAPLDPDRVYELRLEFQDLAYRVERGHRIRVSISATDFQNAWPLGQQHAGIVFTGGRYPSRISLPVAPPSDPVKGAAPLPELPLPTPEKTEKPEYTITRDFVRNRVESYFRVPLPGGHNEAKFSVSIDDPADAVVDSFSKISYVDEDCTIAVEAHCTTTSSQKLFRHETETRTSIDGKLHSSKRWSVSVTRESGKYNFV